jgi:hypothetical protein
MLSPGQATNAITAGGLLGPVGQVYQGAQAFEQLFGPQGSVTRGDIGQIAEQGSALYGNVKGAMGTAANAAGGPSTMSTMGVTGDQFKQINPATGQNLLRQATGPGMTPGSVGGMGISMDEFNNIPPEIRQELLRKLQVR